MTEFCVTAVSGRAGTAEREISRPFVPAVARGLLQRKCACGGSEHGDEGCAECREKKEGNLQRAAISHAAVDEVPPIVHEVLREPGQPLDGATRAFMEPRFGHDFSGVRVHADARASKSARAVNAVAYAVGRDLVFGEGEYRPRTAEGRRLLAHELTHVVQQRQGAASYGAPVRVSEPCESSEAEAESAAEMVVDEGGPSATYSPTASRPPAGPVLSRKVAPRLVHCTPSVHGAPADPVGAITAMDGHAQALAQGAAVLLAVASAARAMSLGGPPSATDQAFTDRFGLPPARAGGFLNRMLGVVRPTQAQALAEEMDLVSARFQLIADTLDDFINYLCTAGATAFGGCQPPCANRDASACAGVDAVFLCPTFWGLTPDSQAILLIHEVAHMIWAHVLHGAAGPGGNFRHAECYASFVADLFGAPAGGPACPPPPP